MINFPIDLEIDNESHHFEVGEYLHHDGESCRIKVFKDGIFVAGFQPDGHSYLHVCQNPGDLDEELIHLLAVKIEAHHPLEIPNDKNKDL